MILVKLFEFFKQIKLVKRKIFEKIFFEMTSADFCAIKRNIKNE